MNKELLQQVLEDICGAKSCEINSMSSRHEMIRLMDKAIAALEAELAKPEQDWDLLKATQESLREHMARIKELKAELAKQTALDKKAVNARELGLDYEPEQEPVACIVDGEVYLADEIDWEELGGTPLYAAPQKLEVEHQFQYTEYGLRGDKEGNLSIGEIPRKPWVGLTDEEKKSIYLQPEMDGLSEIQMYGVIEAKLKEKNT